MAMQVGVQLWSVRDSMDQNVMKTLEGVAAAGYRNIELGNHIAHKDFGCGFDIPADIFKKKCDELGLKVIGSHVEPGDVPGDPTGIYADDYKPGRLIEYYNTLGALGFGLPMVFWPDIDTLKKRCEVMNAAGKRMKENGLIFIYHNHFHEFQYMGDKMVWDLIAENTDPAYVQFELDTYWMLRALIDPAKAIRKYGDRVALLHIKDFPLDQADHLNAWKAVNRDRPIGDIDGFMPAHDPDYFTELGEGIVKVQDAIDAGNEFNIPYVFVEQDFSKLSELESIRVSYKNLKKIRGLDF